MFAEDFQHVRQQPDAGAEENESDHVKRMGVLFAVVGQMQIDEDQTCKANWNVEEEDEPPVKVPNDETSGDRSEHRSYQGRYGNKAHSTQELRLGECSH